MQTSSPYRFLSAAILIMATLSPCSSATAAPPKTPVQIEADQMLSNQKDNSVFFTGKVVAVQEDLTIHSDEMTVFYSNAGAPAPEPSSPESAKELKRLLAIGNVEIIKQDWVATGNQAEYFSDERKVVITGNTKVIQNNNMVTGDTFTMYLDEGRTIVERSQKKGERVKAFFYPDSEKKN